jgi:hypothetical protein
MNLYAQHLGITQTIKKKTSQHFVLQMWVLQNWAKKLVFIL